MTPALHPMSLTGQAAYHDLLRLLKDAAAVPLRGSPVTKTRNGKAYVYDRHRVGTQVRDRYLGEATPELKARLARHAALAADAEAAGRERARLIRVLRAEGYLPVDLETGQLLTAMAGAGVFRLGGTLVGTQAFRMYEGLLGVRISADQAAMTMDIDIASFERLSIALEDRVERDLDDVLSGAGF